MKLCISLIFDLVNIQKVKYGDQILRGHSVGLAQRSHIACWKLHWLEHNFPILKQLFYRLIFRYNWILVKIWDNKQQILSS